MRCRVETSLLASLAYHLDDELVEKGFETVAEAQKAMDSPTKHGQSPRGLTRTLTNGRGRLAPQIAPGAQLSHISILGPRCVDLSTDSPC